MAALEIVARVAGMSEMRARCCRAVWADCGPAASDSHSIEADLGRGGEVGVAHTSLPFLQQRNQYNLLVVQEFKKFWLRLRHSRASLYAVRARVIVELR